MSLAAKFQQTKTLLGLWDTILFAASRAIDITTSSRLRLLKYYFIAQPITEQFIQDSAEVSRISPFTLSWVQSDCPVFTQVERPSLVLNARFAKNAHCLLATHGDDKKFAGFLWFIVGPYDEDEVRARFIPQPSGITAWDFDVTIAPRFRMGRLFSYLWRAANMEMRTLGITHSLSRISAFNAASLASHQRLGGTIVGQATFLCAGRFQLMASSLRPYLHLSWLNTQRPEILVSSNIYRPGSDCA